MVIFWELLFFPVLNSAKHNVPYNTHTHSIFRLSSKIMNIVLKYSSETVFPTFLPKKKNAVSFPVRKKKNPGFKYVISK